MAFTVYTTQDHSPAGQPFGDGDSFHIFSSGVLRVRTKAGATRIYAPGFWQLIDFQNHSEHLRTIE
jgi:hypothetical protein